MTVKDDVKYFFVGLFMVMAMVYVGIIGIFFLSGVMATLSGLHTELGLFGGFCAVFIVGVDCFILFYLIRDYLVPALIQFGRAASASRTSQHQVRDFRAIWKNWK